METNYTCAAQGIGMAVLDDVQGAQRFWTCTGTVISNVFELLQWLKTCSEESFRYHVDEESGRDDFVVWVREVVCDEKLARSLRRAPSRKRYIQRIQRRLRELSKNKRLEALP